MLNQQQSILLNAIFSGVNELTFFENEVNSKVEDNVNRKNEAKNKSQNQGLAIYQHSLIANAARALSITYATVHSYMGKTEFDDLVKQYLKVEIKKEYDWGEFGFTFAPFILTQPIKNSYLLAEIAKLDFACHQAERSKDVTVNLSTLNLLSEHDAYSLLFQLCAGTKVICSTIPLDSVNNTISELTQENKINSLDDVNYLLTEFSNTHTNTENSMLYHFVVFRPDFQATYSRITAAEYEWLTLLLKGQCTNSIPIGQALDEIKNEAFSFVDWLPKAIKERLINGIALNV